MTEMITAGRIDELPPGKIHKIQHGEQTIALVNVDGEFFAVDGICSHAGGPLCRGDVIAAEKVITCPWHGWEYDLRSGECLMDPSLSQKTFAVSVANETVQIALE
tara:strand:- start:5376 stop:5690 length:315 start_codon:yes stop_codon:yes gene_type:complete